MKRLLGVLPLILTAICVSASAQTKTQDTRAHVPANGSQERKAIVDALRGDQDLTFKVHYIKVHNGWCWIDTTPLDKQGHPTAEGGPNLLHLEEGKWKVVDLSHVPEDPKDPMGPTDASRGYVNNLIKTFPGVPRDIFPKPSH
jgi:hypothetical protein